MFLPYAIEDNIERKKNELNVVLNESLNNKNKGNGNKVSSVGIIVFHVLCEVKTIFEGNLVLLYKIYSVSKKMCVEGFYTDRFLNENLNNINKGNGNKVSSVGIIVFHVEAA
jgi:hypothetical protein